MSNAMNWQIKIGFDIIINLLEFKEVVSELLNFFAVNIKNIMAVVYNFDYKTSRVKHSF